MRELSRLFTHSHLDQQRQQQRHIAVRRGCDVDQPRNLAKSVTVE